MLQMPEGIGAGARPLRWAVRALLAVATLSCASPSHAALEDYLGKPIASVALRREGRAVADAGVLDLLETRVGEALTMDAVRETIVHLFSLGRFEDVQVEPRAEPVGWT